MKLSKVFSSAKHNSTVEITPVELRTIEKDIYDICDVIMDKTLGELARARYFKIVIELAKIYNLFKLNMASLNFLIESIEQIDNSLTEPLSIFPDLNLFLLSGNEPIGQCTVKSTDIIWSNDPLKKGSICNQLIYTDIKVFTNYENF